MIPRWAAIPTCSHLRDPEGNKWRDCARGAPKWVLVREQAQILLGNYLHQPPKSGRPDLDPRQDKDNQQQFAAKPLKKLNVQPYTSVEDHFTLLGQAYIPLQQSTCGCSMANDAMKKSIAVHEQNHFFPKRTLKEQVGSGPWLWNLYFGFGANPAFTELSECNRTPARQEMA